MEFWARKQNLSLDKTISFTDGSKVQIEQALVANGLNAGIAAPGLLGITSEDVNTGAIVLAGRAKGLGHPISDYILSPKSPPGIFIVAEHDERQKTYLSYYKLGEGPYYVLLRNYHLCHLEVAKTIRRVLNGGTVLLNNNDSPDVTVAAIAKKPLASGHVSQRCVGSFDVRGIGVSIADNRGHVPIGLLSGAVVTRNIEPGQQLSFDDVEIPDSLALRAWREIEKSV
jgi:predicted homoserine dehydrogenase-like protein